LSHGPTFFFALVSFFNRFSGFCQGPASDHNPTYGFPSSWDYRHDTTTPSLFVKMGSQLAFCLSWLFSLSDTVTMLDLPNGPSNFVIFFSVVHHLFFFISTL
jgi:hypothetical protein